MTLILKNIPDEVFERLKASAEAHRRSLNSEAIACLESVLPPKRVTPGERLARAHCAAPCQGENSGRAMSTPSSTRVADDRGGRATKPEV